MFEARLLQGSLLKKVIEAIKDLVTDANFDCTENDFSLQAMDSSHVSLVALRLEKDGFEHFRCDKPVSMGAHVLQLGACAAPGLPSGDEGYSEPAGCRSQDAHAGAGINLDRMFKMLKCAGSDDIITMSAQDDVDRCTFVFESPSARPSMRTCPQHLGSALCQAHSSCH
jgi:proliferating cell nuclear antigen